MDNPNKPPRQDAGLKNLSAEEHQFLWDLRFHENGKIKTKLATIQMQVPLRYGITCSKSVLSGFYVWLEQKRQWEADVAMADQAKDEFLAERPDASAEELLRVGQITFTALNIRRRDNKGFVALLRAITARENAATARAKAADARASKVEAGLEAMFEQIKGNPGAEEAFRKLQESIKKA